MVGTAAWDDLAATVRLEQALRRCRTPVRVVVDDVSVDSSVAAWVQRLIDDRHGPGGVSVAVTTRDDPTSWPDGCATVAVGPVADDQARAYLPDENQVVAWRLALDAVEISVGAGEYLRRPGDIEALVPGDERHPNVADGRHNHSVQAPTSWRQRQCPHCLRQIYFLPDRINRHPCRRGVRRRCHDRPGLLLTQGATTQVANNDSLPQRLHPLRIYTSPSGNLMLHLVRRADRSRDTVVALSAAGYERLRRGRRLEY